MAICYWITLLLGSAAFTECVLRDLTDSKDLIVAIHNFYRSNERAAHMKALTWNNYLQKKAEQWSENCYWDHQRDGHGENLAYFWTNGVADMTSLEIITKSAMNWWKEVHDWSWSTDCGQACHYTQMVWGATERIGCALSKCPSLRLDSGNARDNADFFVCFYDPPGNVIGRYPFAVGTPCSQCEPGEVCENALCTKSFSSVTKISSPVPVAAHIYSGIKDVNLQSQKPQRPRSSIRVLNSWNPKNVARPRLPQQSGFVNEIYVRNAAYKEDRRLIGTVRMMQEVPRIPSGVLDKIRLSGGNNGTVASYIQTFDTPQSLQSGPGRSFVRRIIYRWTV